MNRNRNRVLAIASLSLGLLVVVPEQAQAQTATQVNRSEWTSGVNLPSYVQMYIYVPPNKAAKPPIVVSSHSCGSTATGQMGNIPHTIAAAQKYGFIIILPDNPGRNCWDVGNSTSLKHDGGGDTQAVAQMVKYAISKYGADPTRVYAMGGSSGGMMTQALMAVYPDVFKAGHARAGVPAGCWADSYDAGQQWSGTCAGGNVNKTAQQWGDLARSYYPGYTGHRPRIQLVQGGSDTTISSKNMTESIEQWTNVLGLDANPTSSDTGFQGQVAKYDRKFWKNDCGFTVLESWVAPGQNHSMGYEEDAMLAFFGLDKEVGGPDPEDAACSGAGDAGAPGGTGGVSGSGGAGGGTGTRDGGPAGRDGGSDVRNSGTGGVRGRGGATGDGGSSGSGGTSGQGGSSGSGGTVGSGGSSAEGGSVGSGGSGSGGRSSSAEGGSAGDGSGGSPSSGGSSAHGGSSDTGGSTASEEVAGGCSCALGGQAGSPASELAVLLLVGLGLIFRRQRRARH